MLTTRRPGWRCSRDRLPEKQSGAHRGVLPEAAKATEDAAFPTPTLADPRTYLNAATLNQSVR